MSTQTTTEQETSMDLGKCSACDGTLISEDGIMRHPRYLRPTCPPEEVVPGMGLVLAFGPGRRQPGPEHVIALDEHEAAQRLAEHEAVMAQLEIERQRSAENITTRLADGGFVTCDEQGRPAEEYLGDGTWRIFRNNPRYCLLTREGMAHPAHEWRYTYQRHDGPASGSTFCDGLSSYDAGHPYPDPPLLGPAPVLHSTEAAQ